MQLPSPLEEIHHELLDEKKIRLFVKRDDLIHLEIMGNKWRKLKYNLEEARRTGFDTLVTFGGAYSNHIAATASAGYLNGFRTIGIIRGEELSINSNPTLEFASSKGMELRFVERSIYRQYRDDLSQFPGVQNAYVIPEGGTNKYAVKGCREIVEEIGEDFDMIVTPIGTGGTFCGLLDGVMEDQIVLGISALKGDFMKMELEALLDRFGIDKINYQINTAYHFGGYAKTNHELIEFINWFKENFNIPLDPIYTAKSFFAVWDMIKSDKFEENLRIVLLHTGGLQGILGFNRKKRNIIQ